MPLSLGMKQLPSGDITCQMSHVIQQPCSQRVCAFPCSDESLHDKESFAISALKCVVVLIVQVIMS